MIYVLLALWGLTATAVAVVLGVIARDWQRTYKFVASELEAIRDMPDGLCWCCGAERLHAKQMHAHRTQQREFRVREIGR